MTDIDTRTLEREMKKGSAELIILSIVESRARHGYEISKLIETRSQGQLKFHVASLYPLLYRMEKRGWTKATWETTPAGVRRRCYGLTAKGLKQLGATRREWDAFFQALSRLGGGEAVAGITGGKDLGGGFAHGLILTGRASGPPNDPVAVQIRDLFTWDSLRPCR